MTRNEFASTLERHHVSPPFAAWLFGVSNWTVRKWRESGSPPSVVAAFFTLLDESGDAGRQFLIKKRLEKHREKQTE